MEGEKVRLSKHNALKWLEKAYNSENANEKTLAAYHLGILKETSTIKDKLIAMEYFTEATKNGHMVSKFKLASMILALGKKNEFGIGEEYLGVYKGKVIRNDCEANTFSYDGMEFKQITQKELKDIIEEQYKLAEVYFKEVIANVSKEGLTSQEQLAIANAYYYLGKMHAEGRGMEKNEATALKFYNKACDLRSSAGMLHCGLLRFEAGGVANKAEACRLLELCAKEGDDQTLYELASKYDRGYILPKNPALAIQYYKQAAEKGNILAQRALGSILHHDAPLEAIRWLRHAAKQDDREAINLLYERSRPSNKPPVADSLLDIVTEINNKMEGREFSYRGNTTYPSQEKRILLEGLENLLSSQYAFTNTETDVLYALCKELFAIKRTPDGWLASDSSREF